AQIACEPPERARQWQLRFLGWKLATSFRRRLPCPAIVREKRRSGRLTAPRAARSEAAQSQSAGEYFSPAPREAARLECCRRWNSRDLRGQAISSIARISPAR